VSVAPRIDVDADPTRTYDVPELNAHLFLRQFLDVQEGEPVELCVLPPSPKHIPHVAYATSYADAVRLMREGTSVPRGTGVYVVPNMIKRAIAARYTPNRWHRADAGRAADHEIELVRTVYIDCDAERPKGISATDGEKARAYELMRRVESFLVHRLGNDQPLGRGDSGNGYSIFIAVEPFAPTKATGERIERLLKALAANFVVPGAKIDTSVFNPARLVPAFGVLKTKGASGPDRPHRPTFFICRPNVRRIPLEVIA
jgi:hypothetical protein